MALHGLLVARDAAFNLRDLIGNGSALPVLAIKDCEKELDKLERAIDQDIPGLITRVGRPQAEELLASLKLITDLERIGDLILVTAQSLKSRRVPPAREDSGALLEMASLLESMLGDLHQGFVRRDLKIARSVLRADARLDRLRHAVFRRHLEKSGRPAEASSSIELLFMVQGLERAGDHVKNLAEELFHMVEGRSLRHVPPRQREREFASTLHRLS
jgi:phosphate transport system protein